MANSIDDAIARLQFHVSVCADVVFKSYPNFPIENADPFPMAVGYVASGSFWFTNATIHHNVPVIRMEFHFSRVNIKQAYQQIDAVILELPRRLAYDPTLNGTVETIISSRDNPVEYNARPFDWGKVQSEMFQFDVPVKLLKAPIPTT